VFLRANMDCPQTRFLCVRYGNVLASRGSVIPLFHDQIRSGGPVTVTSTEMTRFLLTLEQAVDTVFAALRGARRGETYIPTVPSARIADIVKALIAKRPIKTVVTGIRPGEKLHEILISEEEAHRSVRRGDYFVILPILPELRHADDSAPTLTSEYSSADDVMTAAVTRDLLDRCGLLSIDEIVLDGELLR
jgi:FlaA1/EpsC-like NDP-sugar epimerase